MSIHQGEIIREKIEEVGIPFSIVAERMKISRGTLYNRFEKEKVDDLFLLKLGNIIKYDFASVFPHLYKVQGNMEKDVEDSPPLFYSKKYVEAFEKLKKDYVKMLVLYRKAVVFLLSIASDNKDQRIQQKLGSLAKGMNELEESLAFEEELLAST